MPDSASDLSSQIGELKQLYEKGLLSEANFRAALVGLGVSGDQIQRYVERQIIVQGDYFDKRAAPLPPSPTLDAGTALTRYLHHVIQSNRRLQLQGIHSATGLVSIELEQIYITLTAAERRTSDGQWWFDEMADLIRGGTSRASRRRYGHLDETGQQVTMKVQEALREHVRLVVLGDPGYGKTTLLKYLALTFARDLQGETGLVETCLHLKDHRLPVLLPLRDFASYLQKNYPDASTDGPSLLLDYLQGYFAHQDIALPERFFADRLQRAECALLFDGVDEVADLPMRYRVARLIERFTIAYRTIGMW